MWLPVALSLLASLAPSAAAAVVFEVPTVVYAPMDGTPAVLTIGNRGDVPMGVMATGGPSLFVMPNMVVTVDVAKEGHFAVRYTGAACPSAAACDAGVVTLEILGVTREVAVKALPRGSKAGAVTRSAWDTGVVVPAGAASGAAVTLPRAATTPVGGPTSAQGAGGTATPGAAQPGGTGAPAGGTAAPAAAAVTSAAPAAAAPTAAAATAPAPTAAAATTAPAPSTSASSAAKAPASPTSAPAAGASASAPTTAPAPSTSASSAAKAPVPAPSTATAATTTAPTSAPTASPAATAASSSAKAPATTAPAPPTTASTSPPSPTASPSPATATTAAAAPPAATTQPAPTPPILLATRTTSAVRASVGMPTPAGLLTPEQTRLLVEPALPRLIACAGTGRVPQGEVLVALQLAADGRVTGANVTSRSLNVVAAQCIADVFPGLTGPRRAMTVTVPVYLEPAS